MRDTVVDPFESVPRIVVATANDFAAGSTCPAHRHVRGQFALASRGTISVSTPGGRWLVPPGRACWLPPGVEHDMTMRGEVTMLNAFVSPAISERRMPARCGVYGVSALLRHLLEAAVDLPVLYDEAGRAGKLMELLVEEIAAMPVLSLHAPLPADPRLARVCRRLFEAPSMTLGLDAVAAEAGLSRRTFTRLFREQTGASFAEWRQQVCLLVAIERLGAGQPVTRVAFELGYASASAFSVAFRRVLGAAPSRYVEVPDVA